MRVLMSPSNDWSLPPVPDVQSIKPLWTRVPYMSTSPFFIQTLGDINRCLTPENHLDGLSTKGTTPLLPKNEQVAKQSSLDVATAVCRHDETIPFSKNSVVSNLKQEMLQMKGNGFAQENIHIGFIKLNPKKYIIPERILNLPLHRGVGGDFWAWGRGAVVLVKSGSINLDNSWLQCGGKTFTLRECIQAASGGTRTWGVEPPKVRAVEADGEDSVTITIEETTYTTPLPTQEEVASARLLHGNGIDIEIINMTRDQNGVQGYCWLSSSLPPEVQLDSVPDMVWDVQIIRVEPSTQEVLVDLT